MSSDTQYSKADFWTTKALKAGYPARSVYKLEEMDKKFHLLNGKHTALDLGASPGSWTKYLLNSLKEGRVVSCDLNDLRLDAVFSNLIFIKGDLNDKETYDRIRLYAPYDLLTCDAAPLTTGNKSVDIARSEELVTMALQYGTDMLKAGGDLVVKLFQGGGAHDILTKLKKSFKRAVAFKPAASRQKSVEVYLIGCCKIE